MSRKYALVVGISKYQHPLLSLSKTESDADAVALALNQYGNFQEVKLLKGYVSYEELVDNLRTLLIEQAKNNDVVIYFAGHGIPVINRMLRSTEAFLVTSDTSIQLEGEEVTEQHKAISLHDFNALIQQSDLSSLVLLLDSCHSSEILENNFIHPDLHIDRMLYEANFKAFTVKKDYCLITACREFEKAAAIKAEKHSIFTSALLEGLTAKYANSNGEITADSLFGCISERLRGRGQEPFHIGYGGSITLVQHRLKWQAKKPVIEDGKLVCPYQGLRSFTEKERLFFFGRNNLVEEILQSLKTNSLAIITGLSGSGKSSLLQAGLVPRIKSKNPREWQILNIRPESEPLKNLIIALKPYYKREEEDLKRLIEDCGNERCLENLKEILANLDKNFKYMMIIDQFEQIFTECTNKREKERFVSLITQIQLILGSPFSMVIALRADFISNCLQDPQLNTLVESDKLIFVREFSATELVEVIAEPARRQGFTLPKGLIAEIQEEVRVQDKLGFLPLLEFALAKLWDERDEINKCLTHEAYQRIGRFKGALNGHAENFYRYRKTDSGDFEARGEHEQILIEQILLTLIRVREGEPTHRKLEKSKLIEIVKKDSVSQKIIEEILEQLVQSRLVVVGDKNKDSSEIALAHESLIKGWSRFNGWIDSNNSSLKLRDYLDIDLEEWKRNGKNNDDLLRGSRLKNAQELWSELELFLDNEAKYFVSKSIQISSERLIRDKAFEISRSLESNNPVDGLVLAIKSIGESLESFNSVDEILEDGLRRATAKVKESNVFSAHSQTICSIASNQDGLKLASAGRDGIIRLWDSLGNKLHEKTFNTTKLKRALHSVAFHPKHGVVAIGCADCNIYVWDFEKDSFFSLGGHRNEVNSVAFNVKGTLLVSGSADYSVKLWSIRTRKCIQTYNHHRREVNSVAFSYDGKYLASASADKTIQVISISNRGICLIGKAHTDFVNSIAFSPRENFLASGSADKSIRLWKLQEDWGVLDLKDIGEVGLHDDGVRAISFSPNNNFLVSSSSDGIVRVWDFHRKSLMHSLQGHTDSVGSVSVLPGAEGIVSADDAGKIRFWDLSEVKFPFKGHIGTVQSVAFHPKAHRVASGGSGSSPSICLWDTQGNLKRRFKDHAGDVRSIAFSPDGDFIVSGSADHEVRLWNCESGIKEIIGKHDSMVRCVAFGPTKDLIISGSSDCTAKIWDRQHKLSVTLSHSAAILSLSCSRNGYLVCGCSDGGIYLWDLSDWDLKQDISRNLVSPFPIEVGKQEAVRSVSFSPDGRLIATGGDDFLVRLWDLEGNSVGLPFKGHTARIRSVAFSPTGDLIASGGNDNGIRLWNLDGQQVCEPMLGHADQIRSVIFSPDGKLIVSCSSDSTIRVWNLLGQSVINSYNLAWEAYLQVACDRLRYHPALDALCVSENSTAARQVCTEYVWNKSITK